MVLKVKMGISKNGAYCLLLILSIVLVISGTAQTGRSAEIKSLSRPVKFIFPAEAVSEAKEQYFDQIHIVHALGHDKIMVGAKTFHVARGVEFRQLREGMYVGIRLNSAKDTIVAIEQVGKPEWWGIR